MSAEQLPTNVVPVYLDERSANWPKKLGFQSLGWKIAEGWTQKVTEQGVIELRDNHKRFRAFVPKGSGQLFFVSRYDIMVYEIPDSNKWQSQVTKDQEVIWTSLPERTQEIARAEANAHLIHTLGKYGWANVSLYWNEP